MNGKKVEYIIRIGPSDRYRHLHISERRKIVFFRLQYETKINEIWYPVVRYDTAHGFTHRDIMNYPAASCEVSTITPPLMGGDKGEGVRRYE